MSKTLLNRLRMFETLDTYGSLTITELAHHSGLDLTVVSRTVTACEPDGWLTRSDGKITLGPRCAMLAHASPSATLIAAAEALMHTLAGVTGLFAHVTGLVGSQAVLIAAAAGRAPATTAGLSATLPLYATAGGRAIAAQLEPDRLSLLLPPEPFPDAAAVIRTLDNTASSAMFARPVGDEWRGPALPRTRAELDREFDAIRTTGYATDHGALHPAIHCVAVAWPQQAMTVSISCLGAAEDVDGDLVHRSLAAAAQPGATARDIIAAAARGGTRP